MRFYYLHLSVCVDLTWTQFFHHADLRKDTQKTKIYA